MFFFPPWFCILIRNLKHNPESELNKRWLFKSYDHAEKKLTHQVDIDCAQVTWSTLSNNTCVHANTHLSTIFLPHTYSHFVLAPVSMFKGTYGCAGHYCSLQQICDLSHKHTNTLLLFNEHYSINHSRYQAVDTRALGRQKGGGVGGGESGKFHK